MYRQKKDEDVFLKHLRDYRDGELGLYSSSWGNSLGREARLREQRRAQEEAQARRAHFAELDRQRAAQRADRQAYQDMMKAKVPAVKEKMSWRDRAALVGVGIAAYGALALIGFVVKVLGLG